MIHHLCECGHLNCWHILNLELSVILCRPWVTIFCVYFTIVFCLQPSIDWFLVSVYVHVRYMLLPVHLSICLLSSVMLVHSTQVVEIFRNISMAFGTLAIRWHARKFYGDHPRGTPPLGELNTTGVAKYSDFWPIDGYISETVQDRK